MTDRDMSHEELLIKLQQLEEENRALRDLNSKAINRAGELESEKTEIEAFHRSLFESLNGYAYCQMIFEGDKPVDFIYLSVNSAFEKNTGLKDVSGKRISELVPGIRESDPHVFELYGRVARTGNPENFEIYVQSMHRWFAISMFGPKPGYFMAVFDDITRRKATEAILAARLHLIEFAALNTLPLLLQETLNELEILTGSQVGFYHFVEADQRTLSLQTWSTRTLMMMCRAEGAGRHYDVAEAGVWVDCIRERRPVIHNDYNSLAHKKGLPPGHAGVVRELVVPVFRKDKIVAVLGVGNKPEDYTSQDVELVSSLADLAWDITERKQSEKALLESEEKYRRLFDNSNLGIFQSSPEGKALTVNPAFVRMFGYESVKDALNLLKNVASDLFVDPCRRAEIIRLMEENPGMKTFENEYRRKDGSTFTGQLTTFQVRDPNGNLMVIEGIIEDISDRKRAEENFRKIARHYQALIEKAQDGIVLLDTTGNFKYVSPVARKIFGFEATGQILTNPAALTHPEDLEMVLKELGKVFADPTYIPTIKYRFACKNGSWRWVESTFSNLLSYQFVESVLINFRDITESMQAEAEIHRKNEELQRLNAQKDKLFSIIAHDLRSPFNSLLGMAELLEEEMPEMSMEQNRKFASILKNSAKKLVMLVDNLLEWARLQQGQIKFAPGPVQLAEVVSQCAGQVQISLMKKGITLQTDIPQEETVLADHYMLESIFRNLIFNAIKFTPKGGELHISSRQQPSGIVEVSVRDTGIGMNQSMVDRLYQLDGKVNRAGTEGEPGSGLGLVLCKEFVEKHGGKIWVESESGKGTTIHFTIPAKP